MVFKGGFVRGVGSSEPLEPPLATGMALYVVRRPSSVVRPSLTFHIFDFCSETMERYSTKLYRQQDLTVLYHVNVFRADRKNKILIGWDIFDFSSKTAEQNSTMLDRKQDLDVLYQVCVFFFADRHPASGWHVYFLLLLWA